MLQITGIPFPYLRQGRQRQYVENNRGGRSFPDRFETQPGSGLYRLTDIRGIQPGGTGKGLERTEEQTQPDDVV